MAGSSSSNKRKTIMQELEMETEANLKRARQDGIRETTQRFEAILHLVKEQMEMKEIQHDLALRVERSKSKLSLVMKMIGEGHTDLDGRRTRLEEKLMNRESEFAQAVVPKIDWDKLGLKFMCNY